MGFVEQLENLQPSQRNLLKLVQLFRLDIFEGSRLHKLGDCRRGHKQCVAEEPVWKVIGNQFFSIEGNRASSGSHISNKDHKLNCDIAGHSASHCLRRDPVTKIVQELANPEPCLKKKLTEGTKHQQGRGN